MTNRFDLDPEQLARAQALHAKAIVIDGLISSKMDDEGAAILARGGVTANNYTSVFPHLGFEDTIAGLVAHQRKMASLAGKISVVTSIDDFSKAKAAGTSSLITGLQHAPGLGDHPELAQAYQTLGVRIMQLTYNEESPLGYSCLMPEDKGLTEKGRAAVAELNRAGLLIDLSHVGDRTSRDAILESKKPVAFTHANPRSFCNSPRNKPDDVLRVLADRGGVLGVCCWGPACWTSTTEAPTIDTFLDAIAHAIGLVGIDAVGISSDMNERKIGTAEEWDRTWGPNGYYPGVVKHLKWYTFTRRWVVDLDTSASMPNLTQGLVARGYTDEQILKILGGNFLRLFRENWGG
jgi:membrane dipeptidase